MDLLPHHCCAHLFPFIFFFFLTLSLPSYLFLLLCAAATSSSGPVLCASHNQILNKSGKRERAYVREDGRRALVPPLRKETAWSDCSERQKLMVLIDRCFLFRGQDFHVHEGLWCRGSLCLVCVFCPTGNNPSDSITVRHLSQPHDLPGRLSALLSLLASLFGPTHLTRCSSFVCLCQHCVCRGVKLLE